MKIVFCLKRRKNRFFMDVRIFEFHMSLDAASGEKDVEIIYLRFPAVGFFLFYVFFYPCCYAA